jgi:hypothetical protein
MQLVDRPSIGNRFAEDEAWRRALKLRQLRGVPPASLNLADYSTH